MTAGTGAAAGISVRDRGRNSGSVRGRIQRQLPKPYQDPRENPAPIGVPGMALCRRNATAARRAPHKVHAGLPRDAR